MLENLPCLILKHYRPEENTRDMEDFTNRVLSPQAIIFARQVFPSNNTEQFSNVCHRWFFTLCCLYRNLVSMPHIVQAKPVAKASKSLLGCLGPRNHNAYWNVNIGLRPLRYRNSAEFFWLTNGQIGSVIHLLMSASWAKQSKDIHQILLFVIVESLKTWNSIGSNH